MVMQTESIKLVDEAMARDRIIGLLLSRKPPNESDEPLKELYHVGTSALILKMAKTQDNRAQLLVQGLSRFRVKEFVAEKPYPRARVEMRELLRELGAMGKTIIVSSHILSELAELCDWVGIIERGKLVASGSMEEINRLAQQGRTLRIQPLPGELDTLEEALRGQPGVGEIYPLNGALEVAFTGDEEAVAALLASLVAAGVRITSFTEASSSLEETFLRLTKGEVA